MSHCNPTGVGALFAPLFYKPDCFSVGGLWLYNRNYFPKTTGSFLYMIFSIPDRRFPWRFFNKPNRERGIKMKKFQHIIALTMVITLASSTNLYADNCSTAGFTTGNTCTSSMTSGTTVVTASKCTSLSAGCKFINCSNGRCYCNTSDFTCPSTGGSTTDCSSVTCNPIWGGIDNTTHIQTGQAQKPDTSNNCKCINVTDFGATIYRCIAGYYDSTTGIAMIGSKPTCAKCPSIGNNNVAGQSNTGLTDKPTNKGITSCYIPYNKKITDDTGTYIFYKSGLIIIDTGCKWTE